MIIDKIKIGSTVYNVGVNYENVSGAPTDVASQLELNLDSTNYKLKGILKDENGTTIYTSNEIDLPLESVVVNGSYDSLTKELVLTLVNGNTIRISVADLVSGLISQTDLNNALANYYTKAQVDSFLLNKQDNITSSNKLASDLVDDTNSTNKFVTSAEKTVWNGKQDELTAGDNITIEEDQTTGELVISASGGSTETKIEITNSNMTDTAVWQEWLDYYFEHGRAPITTFTYENKIYPMLFGARIGKNNYCNISFGYFLTKLGFEIGIVLAVDVTFRDGVVTGASTAYWRYGDFYSNNEVLVSYTPSYKCIGRKALSTTNTEIYTPTSDYHPATKKYVDDSIFAIDLSGKQDTMQYSTMPTADDTTVGKIVQYTGATDSTYTNGYFYIGTTDGEETPTYSWENINVQNSGGGSSETKIEITTSNMRDTSVWQEWLDYYFEHGEPPITTFTYNNVMYPMLFGAQNSNNNWCIVSFGSVQYTSMGIYTSIIVSIRVNFNNNTKIVTSANTDYWEYGNQRQRGIPIVYGYNDNGYYYKVLATNNTTAFTPTAGSYQPATAKYVDDLPTTYTGYDATKTQVLKNVQGVLTWVDE